MIMDVVDGCITTSPGTMYVIALLMCMIVMGVGVGVIVAVVPVDHRD